MNINEWKVKAEHANGLAVSAKANATAKATAFNGLAFASLQILLMGKVQDEVALAALVSKNGPFHQLRQCVSNARGLLPTLEAGPLTITNKREKTSITVSKEDIMLADAPLFSVAVAYKATRPDAEEGPDDKAFIGLALEAEGSGLTTRDVLKMSSAAIEDYMARGRAIHEAANSPLNAALAAYAKLSEHDKSAFVNILSEREPVAA